MNISTESLEDHNQYNPQYYSKSAHNSLDIVIFAGGESKRMNSSINKVLLKIAHKPMIDYVLDAATKLQPNSITVVTCAANNNYIVENLNKRQNQQYDLQNENQKHEIQQNGIQQNEMYDKEKNKGQNYDSKVLFNSILQKTPQGTGNAAQIAYNHIKNQKNNQNDNRQTNILFLYGDTPLIKPQTLQNAMQSIDQRSTDIMVFGIHSEGDDLKSDESKYASYGRIFFKNQKASQSYASQPYKYEHQTNIIREISEIVEAKDLTHQDKDKKKGTDYLYNSGIMYLSNNALHLLNDLPKHKIQGDNDECKEEYYLTDIVHLSNLYNSFHSQSRLKCECILINSKESMGVNSKEELTIADSIIQNRLRKKHIENGAILLQGESTYFSHDTQIGKDAIIHPNVFFEENVVIHDNAKILPCSFLSNCIVYENSTIGPFATLRNNTKIKANSHIGNFVEIKNSTLENSTKAKHLSYIGDTKLGSNSNIGAGVIFCNFDGVNKNKSNIGKNVFIGSNSSIISPISIGDDSIIAAGSVISKNLQSNTLSITRSEQKNIKNGASRYKNLKKKK